MVPQAWRLADQGPSHRPHLRGQGLRQRRSPTRIDQRSEHHARIPTGRRGYRAASVTPESSQRALSRSAPSESGCVKLPWFKVDDTLAFHAKTLAAGNAAMGLWVRAGAWSMQTLSDGFIPTQVAHQLGTKREAARLVFASLWVETDDGYRFHEWDQRQPSRAKVHTDREANAEKLRKWREKNQKGETDA